MRTVAIGPSTLNVMVSAVIVASLACDDGPDRTRRRAQASLVGRRRRGYSAARASGGLNGVHSPAGWARRSAIAHSAPGWCPRPTWLLTTSTLSVRAAATSRDARHGTIPSVRLKIAVDGTASSDW